MTTHYTYKIEFETGHFYFGVRSCECLPKDDPYLGSPSYYKDYWDNYEPKKYIISTHLTRQEAADYESVLIDYGWSINRQLSLNASNLGFKFSTYGKPLSKERKEQISKPFKLISPEGQIVEGLNITQFAKENRLSKSGLSQLLNQKIFQHKGYTRNLEDYNRYLKLFELRGVYYDTFIEYWVVSWNENKKPTKKIFREKEQALHFRDDLEKHGIKFSVKSRGNFAAYHDFPDEKINKTNKGIKHTDEARLRMSKPFSIVSPEGELIEGFNLTRFAEENNLSFSAFSSLVRGVIFHYKGYTRNLEDHKLYKKFWEDRGICFGKENRVWIVSWQENKKQKSKYFKAKEEATAFRDSLEQSGIEFKILMRKNRLNPS
jgi:hypothetical protein